MQTKLYGLDTGEQKIQHSPGQIQRLGFLSLLDVSSSHINHIGISNFEMKYYKITPVMLNYSAVTYLPYITYRIL